MSTLATAMNKTRTEAAEEKGLCLYGMYSATDLGERKLRI
jgi:hypothetical protein